MVWHGVCIINPPTPVELAVVLADVGRLRFTSNRPRRIECRVGNGWGSRTRLVSFHTRFVMGGLQSLGPRGSVQALAKLKVATLLADRNSPSIGPDPDFAVLPRHDGGQFQWLHSIEFVARCLP